jgi:hypothetical protein
MVLFTINVTPPSYLEGPGFKTQPQRPAILIEVFMGFLSPSRQMLGQYLKIRPRPLLTKTFPIYHHSSVTLSSTLYSLRTENVSENKLPTNHQMK